MSEREAFVRQICERPDDDVVRLVFADWLEECSHDRVACPACNGKKWTRKLGERKLTKRMACVTCGIGPRKPSDGTIVDDANITLARFIRAQMAGAPEVQLKTLFANLVRKWPVPPSHNYINLFSRGFLFKLRCFPNYFAEECRSIFALHPITEVEIIGCEPHQGSATNRFGWLDDSNPLWTIGAPPHIVPLAIAKHFTGHELAKNRGWCWYAYKTRADALAGLSNACVAYGRSLAGLPPLPRPEVGVAGAGAGE